MFDEMLLLHLQAAELAEYSVKISLLEEAKRSKEEEAESWHSKVSFQQWLKATKVTFPPEMVIPSEERMKPQHERMFTSLEPSVLDE